MSGERREPFVGADDRPAAAGESQGSGSERVARLVAFLEEQREAKKPPSKPKKPKKPKTPKTPIKPEDKDKEDKDDGDGKGGADFYKAVKETVEYLQVPQDWALEWTSEIVEARVGAFVGRLSTLVTEEASEVMAAWDVTGP